MTDPLRLTITYPPDLPVSARRAEIVAALRAHQVLIIAGETGSGKTTQLPKMCLEAGLAERGRIGCTQPRRVAAMSVSKRVAEELGVQWGREVGCKMRFNDDTSRETRVKFMTDGILLAEIQSDPELRAYSALILDEAHERSLNIDFLLGYLQQLLKRRPDLKLVITSATIDTEAFSQAFGGAPVIEVSGRLFPVEIRYLSPENVQTPEEQEPPSPVESAARVTEELLLERDDGDLLVFLPTERDIREAQEILETSLGSGIEILPLFGRMASAEQQRIFLPGGKRRVVLATNVAETSLTIPRIGAVIDTGLARISRYNPRTRTKRLPIEPVSQSSANQRAGRAGRLREGLCVRLYTEEDFEKRPRFTQPEIQRANLAEVILRMIAFRLGEVETFPFINPPLPQAIRAGYQLLEELGALREDPEEAAQHARWQLTPLGRELARLPLDPTLARMLLQAREEGALDEMLIIAAGLSIPDPRERPEEAREAAAAAHKLLAHPESDFMGLLNIWNAAPPLEGGPVRTSRNALRRFCKTHYLSLTRVREWRDLYRQLAEAMRPPRRNRQPEAPPPLLKDDAERYRAIHRSILAGLLGQIGQRHEERNQYKASGNRLLTLFPGSSLYNRKAKPKPKGSRDSRTPPQKKEAATGPEWIVSAEIVQTSQLFARTVAGIDPQWVIDLGGHLCQFRHSHPAWSAKAGRVLVTERALIHGLELSRRQIDYGRINPSEATELFIRGALLASDDEEDALLVETTEQHLQAAGALQQLRHLTPAPRKPQRAAPAIQHRFFKSNQALLEKIEATLAKLRSGRVHNLTEAFYRFYAERLQNISSIHDLDRLIRREITKDPDFLHAQEADLLQPDDLDYDQQAFPDEVPLGNSVLPLTYAYTPGEERDGVTLRVPLPLAGQLSTGRLQWMIPGLRLEQATTLLRSLPKTTRKTLQPLEPKIAEVATEFDPGDDELFPALSRFLYERHRILIPVSDWQPLPAHLCPRVEVVDRRNRALAAGRDLDAVQAAVDKADLRSRNWDRLSRQWEQKGLTRWPSRLPYNNPGEAATTLPDHVIIERVAGEPLLGYPGFRLEEDGSVSLLLFRKKEDRLAAAPAALHRMAELYLAEEKAWLLNEFRTLGQKVAAETTSKQGPLAQALSGLQGLKSFQSLQSLQNTPSPAKPSSTPAPFRKPTAPAKEASLSPASLCPEAASRHVTLPLFALQPALPLSLERFEAMLDRARKALPEQARRLAEQTAALLRQRDALLATRHRYPGFEADVERLIGADFLERTPPAQLQHLSRYIKAIGRRAERAAMNPAKDAEKARQLARYDGWEKRLPPHKKEPFRWLLEELRVSLFAQELGTAQPVSPQRLDAFEQADS